MRSNHESKCIKKRNSVMLKNFKEALKQFKNLSSEEKIEKFADTLDLLYGQNRENDAKEEQINLFAMIGDAEKDAVFKAMITRFCGIECREKNAGKSHGSK